MDNIQQWEYEYDGLCHPRDLNYITPVQQMNERAQKGWEAFAIYEGNIYFKRPKLNTNGEDSNPV